MVERRCEYFLALALAASGYWIATWYQQPSLRYLLFIAAVTLVVGALGQQIRVLATKQLRFADLAKVELPAAVVGFISAVILAGLGAGAYAIVAGSLMTASVSSCMLWVRLSRGWRPKARLRLTEISRFLKFGLYMIGNNLANTFNSQIDILLGGQLLGVQSIGMYNVPKDLSLRIGNIINPVVTRVAMPVMAKAQDNAGLLKNVYLLTIRMTASVNFPIYVVLALFAPEFVYMLLGSQWLDAIPLLRIFAVWAMLRSAANPVGSLLMATGRADLSFRWNLALLLVMLPAIWVGSFYGVLGLAAIMSLVGVLTIWPNWYFLVRPLCGAKFGEYAIQLSVPFALSIVAGLVGYVSANLWEASVLRLIGGITISGLVYFALSWQLNQVWANAMKELLGLRSEKNVG